MSAARIGKGCLAGALALALLGAAAPEVGADPAARAAAPLRSARAIAKAMAGGKRGEAKVRWELADPLGGPARTVQGRVQVEPPDRVKLDLGPGGERIALRGDGGEWLQPVTRQLLRIPAERSRTALQWWRVLLPGSAASFAEDSIAPRTFALRPLESDPAVSRIVVRLGADGLPAELTVEGMADAPLRYRLSGWAFGPARGAAAYRLTAPAGFETVDLP